MSTLYREVPEMLSENNQSTKDIVWNMFDKSFIIRNVPYSKIEVEGEEFLGLGVSVKLELIRELMLQDEIPHDVNFTDIADLKFS